MKRILITGINGFVGSHLADLLLDSEKDATIFGGKRVNGRMRNVKHILTDIEWIDYDITDYSSVRNLIEISQPDQIYHLAAMSWVTPSLKSPSIYMQVNAIGTINLFEALVHLGVTPKVFVSCTPEEFGDVKKEDLPIKETTLVAPVNHYAASKAAQDAVCQSYFASYKIPIIRTRAFNHEGPRRDVNGAIASFSYQVANIEAGNQEPVIKVGNLEAKRNFTDVRDMVKAYQMAMEKCVPGELYLIGSDQIYTMKECLEQIISLSTMADKITYEVDEKRLRPTELNYLIGDMTKFSSLTGWKISIPFDQMLIDILEYWRRFISEEKE